MAVVVLLRAPGRLFGAVAAFASFYVPCAAIIAVGRMTRLGPVAGLDLRIWADALVFMVLIAALAVLGGREERTQSQPAESAADPAPTHSSRRRRLFRIVGVVGAASLSTLYVVNVGHSTVVFGREWAKNPSGAFVAQLRREIDAIEGTPRLVATEVPQVVPFIDPYYDVGDLLAPLKRPVDVNTESPSTQIVDDDALLQTVLWTSVATLPRGPVEDCGWAIAPGAEPLTLAFAAPVPYYDDNQFRLSLLVSGTTGLDVNLVDADGQSLIDLRAPLTFERGIYRLNLRIVRGGRPVSVTIAPVNPNVGVCVTGAAVSSPRPLGAPLEDGA